MILSYISMKTRILLPPAAVILSQIFFCSLKYKIENPLQSHETLVCAPKPWLFTYNSSDCDIAGGGQWQQIR